MSKNDYLRICALRQKVGEIDPWYEKVRLSIGQLAKLIVTMQKRKFSAVDLLNSLAYQEG